MIRWLGFFFFFLLLILGYNLYLYIWFIIRWISSLRRKENQLSFVWPRESSTPFHFFYHWGYFSPFLVGGTYNGLNLTHVGFPHVCSVRILKLETWETGSCWKYKWCSHTCRLAMNRSDLTEKRERSVFF